MSEITPPELSDRLESDDEPFILDIRDEDDYEDWHIPGSENVEVYKELQDEPIAARDALAEVPDEEVVTVCAAGVVSRAATEQLREMGYDAKTLVDGMRGWSQVHRSVPVDLGIDGTLIQVARPGKGCLSYVLVSDSAAAVFDPSQYVEEYEALLEEHDAELVGVFDTHAHADHVSGGAQLAERYGVDYHLHPADAADIDAAPLSDGQSVEVGSLDVDVVHTPGHSPGGVTFVVEGEALLTGDTLFHESVGRVELGVEAGIEETAVEANAESLYESLQRLREFGDDSLVLPAHDSGTPDPPVAARLGELARWNDDLQLEREDFVVALVSDVPEHPPNFQRIKAINTGAESATEESLSDLELGPNRCAAE